MTTSDVTAVSRESVDAALAAATVDRTADEQRLATAVLRLLAGGAPVTLPAVAAAAGLPESSTEQVLRSWPGVFWNDQQRVIGFWGLALAAMPHRIRHADTDLYAWCAWDPFFLARVIGDLRVSTIDPVTNETITYRLGEDGAIADASHPRSVLSFLRPDQPWGDDVQTTFCHYVRHFTSSATARRWTTAHPGTFVINLADAVELAGRHTARVFGIGPT